MLIASQGDPRFHGNVFHSEIVLNNGAFGLYQYNELKDGVRGATVSSTAEPVFQFNHIHRQTQCGVHVTQNGKGVIRHNLITHCKVAG